MKKDKKRPSAFRAMALRIGALVLGLWLLAMGLLTWAVAADMQHQFKSRVDALAVNWDNYHAGGKTTPIRIHFMRNLGSVYNYIDLQKVSPFMDTGWENTDSNDWRWGNWNLIYGFEIAELYSAGDNSRDILVQTGDYLSFAYTPEPIWNSEHITLSQYAYIVLPEELRDMFSQFPNGFNYPINCNAMRMTGYFEGDQFHPSGIESGSIDPQFYHKYFGYDSPEQLLELDTKGLLLWQPLYTQPAPADKELHTIYCWDLVGYISPLQAVTADKKQYSDLVDFYLSGDFFTTDNLRASSYARSVSIEEDGTHYRYTIIARYWPLQYAALRLIPTYLISFGAVALCLSVLLWQLRKKLTKPISQLVEFGVADVDDAWAEPHALDQQISENRQALTEASTELQQLRTALFYAQNAEESRKNLVSSIAHELKTPLAVIHSYAEGLQAGIAPEKQEKYLSTILSETEKMDGMVLQMLDLSRLEAGRVRLSADRLSLSSMTRSIAEKLAPMLEEKALTIHFDLVSDFALLADESRMEQVVTNLLGNAIKYTPNGGQIHIKIFTHAKQARFLIENTAPHLSEEALAKVWDSFYRADPARSEPGTGLGLALVKQIVELHRGSCAVRNSQAAPGDVLPTSVEFGFSLPLM